MLYICILSNKFDLKQTIRVLHKAIQTSQNETTFVTLFVNVVD